MGSLVKEGPLWHFALPSKSYENQSPAAETSQQISVRSVLRSDTNILSTQGRPSFEVESYNSAKSGLEAFGENKFQG